MNHFNKLTPAQAERLAMLFEEASEIIQIAGKTFRHGYKSYHPADIGVDNIEYLSQEIGDFLGILDKMIELSDVDEEVIAYYRKTKWGRAMRYAHHQEK